MDAADLKIGMLVTVGPAYKMSDRAPHIGNGTYEADEWTGRTYRVVAVRKASGALGCDSVALADPLLIDVDESDEIVDISARRLTPH